MFGKWTLSGITSASTGAPFSPACSSTAPFPANDPTLTGITARCQEVADPRAFTQSFYSNFNTAAFAMAPYGSFGNTGLGIFRQPATVDFDMALDKVIPLGEKRVFRIKWQAYNVFNHAEFNAIGSTYTFQYGRRQHQHSDRSVHIHVEPPANGSDTSLRVLIFRSSAQAAGAASESTNPTRCSVPRSR